MRKTFSYLLLGFLFVLIGLYVASPISPVMWQPDANAGLKNMYSTNDALGQVRIVGINRLAAPEDLVVDETGTVYTGLVNGDIVSFNVNTPNQIETIANTGGRPLGIRLDANGDIVVSDAFKGLLRVSLQGEVEVLVDEYMGRPLRFVDHHDIAANGDIYFSDASENFSLDTYIYDFLEASATGSIYRYSPTTGKTVKLMSDLFFANGVALGPNDEFLLVAETGKSRILKLHLSGPLVGQTTVFANNLPAMPDNLSFNGTDTFWAGMVSLRDWRVESLAPYPELRQVMGTFPVSILEPTSHYGFVLGFDLQGQVVGNYQTPDAYTAITSAYEYQGQLYLGSLHSQGIAVYPLGQ